MSSYKLAMKGGYFWRIFLSDMFLSKGKIALWQYLAKKELEYWGKEATDEALKDWHNVGLVARVAYEVTRI